MILRIVLCLLLLVGMAGGADIPKGLHHVLWEAKEELEAGDLEGALRRLEDFRRSHPELRHYLLSLKMGDLCWRLGRRGEAVEHWQEAVELNPRAAQAWQNLGQAYYGKGRFQEAARAFLKAWELTQDPELRLYGAISLLKAERPEEALVHLEGLLKKGKADRPLLEGLLQAYLQVGKLQEAKGTLWRLLKDHPTEVKYWKALAGIYLRQREHLRAAAALEVALRLQGDTRIGEELAGLYQLAGLWLKAARTLEALYPDPPAKACDRIADLYLLAGRPAEALKYLDMALSKAPARERFLKKGKVFFELGRYREAYKAFSQAASDDGYAYLMMGYCAWFLEDLERAQEALRRAVRFPPYRKRAEALLEAIHALKREEKR